jgi:hypothetical protein
MDAEREFPRYVFCYDGTQAVVQTKEDYDRMQPGWGATPNGPFQGTDLATLQWDLEYAPFAPRHRWQQTGDSPRNAKLYTPGWLIIEKRAYAPCELLPPPVTPLQEELRLREILRRIPDSAEFAKSAWTGGWFFGVGWRDAYDRRYEEHDLSGIEWYVYPPQDTALTLEPEAAAHSGPGRPRDAEWRSWTLPHLIAILKSGLHKARETPSDTKRLRFQDVADATGYERRDLSRSMNKYGHTWETIRKLLNE